MERNRLSGVEGDRFNAILSAVGMNFHKLLRWVAAFLRRIFYWLLYSQRTTAMVACS
jgi:IS5 family transposase